MAGVRSPMGINRPEREADHSPPSTEKVKNYGAVKQFPHM